MKKRLLALTLLGVMVFTMLAASGCSNNSEPENIGEEYIFVQGINPAHAPFTSADEDGNVTGFDVELCQALCEELGWTYDVRILEWNERDAALEAGECDCIWSSYNIEGNEGKYSFSIPYGTVSQDILIRKDSGIKTLDDLVGRMVAVQDGTAAYDEMNTGASAELAKSFGALIVEASAETCFDDLNRGAVDAMVVDCSIGDYLIKENPDDYEYMSEYMGWDTYAVAFRKDDAELAGKVSEGLKALADSGKFDEIAAKYPDIKPYLYISSEE